MVDLEGMEAIAPSGLGDVGGVAAPEVYRAVCGLLREAAPPGAQVGGAPRPRAANVHLGPATAGRIAAADAAAARVYVRRLLAREREQAVGLLRCAWILDVAADPFTSSLS